MNQLTDFFITCSGIHRSILKKSPTDTNKYIGIGATVFFTGLLAAISSGYAIYTVFDSWVVSCLFAIVWGLMIFNLDRYLVSSMKHAGSGWRDFWTATPRILMAIVISIVISKPLELKIFEKEINAELISMEQEVYKKQSEKVQDRFQSQIASLQSDVTKLKSEINAKQSKRDEMASIALQEADGTGGSKQKNLGPIYKAKKLDADKADAELKDLVAIHQPLIDEKEKAISQIQNQQTSEINALQKTALGGFASRIDALSRLAANSNAIWMASLFIMLLFIIIETAPIFVKLISGRSPYEYILNKHEHAIEMNHKEITSILANTVKNKISMENEVNTYANQSISKSERKMIDEALNKEVERLKQGPLDWNTWWEKGGFLKGNLS